MQSTHSSKGWAAATGHGAHSRRTLCAVRGISVRRWAAASPEEGVIMTVRLRLFLSLLLVGCLALAGLGGAAQADSGTFTLEVVAAQLNNPRGLTVARSGAVYVAEAGRGGANC